MMANHKPRVLVVLPRGYLHAYELLQKQYPNIPTFCVLKKSIFDKELPDSLDTSTWNEVEIYFGGSYYLRQILPLVPNLKWIHTMAAGVEDIVQLYRENMIPRHVKISRSGTLYGRQMARYVIGQIIALDMNFYQHATNQKLSLWTNVGDSTYQDEDRRTGLNAGGKDLCSRVVTILGLGDIGMEVARACKLLDMTVWGVTRTKWDDARKKSFVNEYRQTKDLPEVLASCDFLVNVLPSTAETRGLLNGDVLGNCKRKPVFINIGRGCIIDDESLLNAVRMGWLSKAVIDVFTTEPLPSHSPLWREKNITITPHIASGCDNNDIFENLLKLFINNHKRFLNGQPLECTVDPERGY